VDGRPPTLGDQVGVDDPRFFIYLGQCRISSHRGESVIEWGMLEEWQGDWLTISAKAIRERQKWLETLNRGDLRRFTEAIREARSGRVGLVRDYAPHLLARLSMDSSVATATRGKHLLETAKEHEPREWPNLHTWFDAICVFDASAALALIEQQDPRTAIGDSLYALIGFLRERLFEPGFETTDFYVYRDPTCDFTVSERDIGIGRHLSQRAKGRVRLKSTLNCRRVRGNGLVFLDERPKEAFSEWVKVLRQVALKKPDPYRIRDRRGLMLVCESHANILALCDRLEVEINASGGCVTERPGGNHETNAPVDPTNHSSSSAYKVVKLCVRWRGREFEIQFITFYDYFNSQLSTSPANHQLYKLRQALEFAFPLLFPSSVYGVKWNSTLIGQFEARLKSALVKRVNGARKPADHS